MFTKIPRVIAIAAIAACGGSKPAVNEVSGPPATSAAPSASAVDPAGKTSEGTASGSASAGPAAGALPTSSPTPKTRERPSASSSAEAMSLVDDAIDGQHKAIAKCVQDARNRRKETHADIVVELGIDQEGHLLGVKTPKGHKDDRALNECVKDALHDAPFPRTKAGVITVRKNFSEMVIYPE